MNITNSKLQGRLDNSSIHCQFESFQTAFRVDLHFPQSRLASAVRVSCLALGFVSGFSSAVNIEVTSHLDNGTACTLRDAIDTINNPALITLLGCANSGSGFGIDDTISFSNNLTSNTITLSNSQLSFGRALNQPNVEVTIDADSVTGGIHVDAAGGSRVIKASYSNLSIRNMTLTGGVSDGTNDLEKSGGALTARASTVTLNNSVISRNYANNLGGGIYLYNSSVLILNESEISNNSTAFNSGGIDGGYNSTITLNNSDVSHNSAANSTGGISITSSTLTLNNSTLIANSTGAIGSGGISASGDSNVILNDSSVSDNHGVGLSTAGGGSNTLSINRSRVLNNAAIVTGGGGINGFGDLMLVDSIVSGNSGPGSGGGIGRILDSATLINTVVSNNTAGNLGGGIDAFAGGKVYLINSTVSNNTSSGRGGGINVDNNGTIQLTNSSVYGNSSDASGGGLAAMRDSNLTIMNSTISGNSAGDNGGGIDASLSVVDLTHTTVADNLVEEYGGGLYIDTVILKLKNSILANSELGLGEDSLECYELSSISITVDPATIIEDGSCGALRIGDPALLPLADNEGATQTHALSQSSIARNSAPANSCLAEDQRGVARDITTAFCDVGAFEFIDVSTFYSSS